MITEDVFCPFALESSWKEQLQEELAKPYISQLAAFVEKERLLFPIYPPKELVFNALQKTPYDKVKVVIVGQDPYHGPGQAHGLCFSVPKGTPIPPSLLNIFKEIQADIGIPISANGCLSSWAEQGVLLLNATLTVRQGEPLSHHRKGWEMFTDAIIAAIYKRSEPVIFLLWGKSAQEKYRHVCHNEKNHIVLTAAHPSPLSAHQGFLGCRHFSKVNELLVARGSPPVDWSIK